MKYNPKIENEGNIARSQFEWLMLNEKQFEL